MAYIISVTLSCIWRDTTENQLRCVIHHWWERFEGYCC